MTNPLPSVLRIAPLLAFVALGCRKAPPEPESTRTVEAEPATTAAAASSANVSSAVAASTPAAASANAAPSSAAPHAAIPPGHHKVQAKPVQSVPVSPDDPLKGKFTLDDATKGLAGTGGLVAEMKTDQGTLDCELYADKAPITVANFVGLARGLRPFKDPKGQWVKKPAYDGTTFHRIIKGFMIQGGDPEGTGAGEPGYVLPDEIWEDAYHSERGLLCMANRGANTNGMQFFIMDGSAPHLDGGYTIFGKCSPSSVIEKLANSEVRGDRALNPPKIQKVTIHRGAAPKK